MRATGSEFRSAAWLVREHLYGAADHELRPLARRRRLATTTTSASRQLEKLAAERSTRRSPRTTGTTRSTSTRGRRELAREPRSSTPTGSARRRRRDTHAVDSEGRWAYTPCWSSAREFSAITNPYGLLRSPWNTNPTPYLTRHDTVLGLYADDYAAARRATTSRRRSSGRRHWLGTYDLRRAQRQAARARAHHDRRPLVLDLEPLLAGQRNGLPPRACCSRPSSCGGRATCAAPSTARLMRPRPTACARARPTSSATQCGTMRPPRARCSTWACSTSRRLGAGPADGRRPDVQRRARAALPRRPPGRDVHERRAAGPALLAAARQRRALHDARARDGVRRREGARRDVGLPARAPPHERHARRLRLDERDGHGAADVHGRPASTTDDVSCAGHRADDLLRSRGLWAGQTTYSNAEFYDVRRADQHGDAVRLRQGLVLARVPRGQDLLRRRRPPPGGATTTSARALRRIEKPPRVAF